MTNTLFEIMSCAIRLFLIGLFLISTNIGLAQYDVYSLKDSLRGSLRAERTCFDVVKYNLTVDFDFDSKHITGTNTISFLYDGTAEEIQIDLFENLQIDSIVFERPLPFRRVHDAVFISADSFIANELNSLNIHYSGQPVIANNPPWDGGFIWSEDGFGNTWLSVACEGLGASAWWPNKDHLSDEVDSIQMTYIIPNDYACIANGDLLNVSNISAEKHAYTWAVSYPINNYNVSFNIGKYVHFQDYYKALDGDSLKLDYYVLREHLDIAKVHFKQTHDVLEAFEFYFDKYPFWRDGFALVETPYLGMEHQSAIAYGNKFMRGYLGGRIPYDMDFDYIILHETAHEYFGNSVSCEDMGDLWIHESFATYMESMFVEYHMGQAAAQRYLNGQRRHFNIAAMIGPKGVNYNQPSHTDIYFKGSWILHTLRNLIDDDERWFNSLKQLYQQFAYSTTNTRAIVAFLSKSLEIDLHSFFDHYLNKAHIPELEYYLENKGEEIMVSYKWNNTDEHFTMPVNLGNPDQWTRVQVRADTWQSIALDKMAFEDFEVDRNSFLIDVKRHKKKPF